MSEVTTIGLDIAKNVLHANGAQERGRGVFSKRLTRAKVLDFFAAQPPCTVALEACGGAHHCSRADDAGTRGATDPTGLLHYAPYFLTVNSIVRYARSRAYCTRAGDLPPNQFNCRSKLRLLPCHRRTIDLQLSADVATAKAGVRRVNGPCGISGGAKLSAVARSHRLYQSASSGNSSSPDTRKPSGR